MLFNFLYACLLVLLSPLIMYRMIRFGRYRRGWPEKLWGLSARRAAEIRNGHSECVWIHAVSVGEVNLLPEFVRQFQSRRPGVAVAISTSTDTGYDLAIKLFGRSKVFFCPLDFTWAVSRALERLSPQQIVLTELELWPNLVRLASAKGSRLQIINGRLSEKSASGYQRFAKITRPTFARFDAVGCQDAEIRDRFAECGVPKERLFVTGSIKFDNAPNSRETPEVMKLVHWSGIDPWHRVWIVGSTQDGEEEMAFSVYEELRKQYPELRLIIVPRHAERFNNVHGLIEKHRFQCQRRSSDPSLADKSWNSDRIILVDTIGELRHWWGVGQIATVGGSFGSRGGQNMLEPAGYGSAVSFGPNTKNFRVIADGLIDAGGAVRVADRAELKQFVQRCLSDVPAADALGVAAKNVVASHGGAIQRTLDLVASDTAAVVRRAA